MPSLSGQKLAEWSGGEWLHGIPATVNGVSTDSRRVAPGSLFVALKGRNFDGHNYVADSLAGGAAAAMISAGSGAEGVSEKPLLRVDDTLSALQRMAAGYRGQVDPLVIGVTGSAGKTTVKEMIADLLETAQPTARTAGNFNNEIGIPLSLLAMDGKSRAGVFEVGISHPGEMAPLCGLLEPDWGVVTNVGPVHLEFFESVQAIAREKAGLVASLPADGIAVLCRDSEYFAVLKEAARCRVVTVSMDGDADYVLSRGECTRGMTVVVETATAEHFGFSLAVPGEHNICNALLAIAVARCNGVKWEQIKPALRKFRPPSMRWSVEDIAGVKFINDAYNANPVSMRAALDTFAGLETQGRKWLVLGGMLELGAGELEQHRAMGRLAAAGPWEKLVVVGERGAWIAGGAAEAGLGKDRISLCENGRQAARVLAEGIKQGDTVLLKGSRGMKMEEVRNEYVLLSLRMVAAPAA